MMSSWRSTSCSGFTLIEMVIAFGLSLFTLSAIYVLYVNELQAQHVREDQLDMQQQARVVIDVISREVVMAGYDPMGVNIDDDPTNDFLPVTYDPTRLKIQADLSGNGVIADANESITFIHDSATHTLRRNTGGGNQPFGENIESFVVQYFDDEGNPTTESRRIRQVEFLITARTERPDPNFLSNDGYRTVMLRSRLTPRNLS